MPEETPRGDEPVWPILVVEQGIPEAYTKEHWYGDGDLCDAGTWGDSAVVIDSSGATFSLVHRVLNTGKTLHLIPTASVTNIFVRQPQEHNLESISIMLRDLLHPSAIEPILAGCREADDCSLKTLISAFSQTDL